MFWLITYLTFEVELICTTNSTLYSSYKQRERNLYVTRNQDSLTCDEDTLLFNKISLKMALKSRDAQFATVKFIEISDLNLFETWPTRKRFFISKKPSTFKIISSDRSPNSRIVIFCLFILSGFFKSLLIDCQLLVKYAHAVYSF